MFHGLFVELNPSLFGYIAQTIHENRVYLFQVLKFNFKRRQGITYQSVEKSSRNSDIVEMESVNIFTNEMPFERGLSFARRQ